MEADPYKFWDLVIKGLALIGAILGATWTIFTYTDTREKEFYTPFWNKKFDLYIETSRIASRLATTRSEAEFNDARSKFASLFFGELSLVEGSTVKAAMECFSQKLPLGEVKQGELPLERLQQPAYRLTLTLKDKLGHAWERPFRELFDINTRSRAKSVDCNDVLG